MPNIRPLTLVSQTELFTTFEDPSTLKTVQVATDAGGVPTGVTIDGVALTLSSTTEDRRRFTGTVSGALWQVDTFGVGATMTARATTRS